MLSIHRYRPELLERASIFLDSQTQQPRRRTCHRVATDQRLNLPNNWLSVMLDRQIRVRWIHEFVLSKCICSKGLRGTCWDDPFLTRFQKKVKHYEETMLWSNTLSKKYLPVSKDEITWKVWKVLWPSFATPGAMFEGQLGSQRFLSQFFAQTRQSVIYSEHFCFSGSICFEGGEGAKGCWTLTVDTSQSPDNVIFFLIHIGAGVGEKNAASSKQIVCDCRVCAVAFPPPPGPLRRWVGRQTAW